MVLGKSWNFVLVSCHSVSVNTNLLKIYVSRQNITRSAKLKKTNFEKNPLPGYTVLITEIYVLITEKILFHSVALLSKLSTTVM